MKPHTNAYGIDRKQVPLDTGYANAAETWDRRMGLLSSNARRWRSAAVASMLTTALLGAGLVYAASRRQVELYVVEVDPAEARTIGVELGGRAYTPDANAKAYFVAKLVRDARSRVLDPVVQARRWREVYSFLAGPAERRMNEYAAADSGLTADGRRAAREVEINSVLQRDAASGDDGGATYQVRWTERTYAGGALVEEADHTGEFTVAVEPPTDKRAILTNPLGLYVTDINWGRDFSRGG